MQLSASYTYTVPGTYFPVVRVTSNRNGDVNAKLGRVDNLARIRVVVTELDQEVSVFQKQFLLPQDRGTEGMTVVNTFHLLGEVTSMNCCFRLFLISDTRLLVDSKKLKRGE